MPEEVPELKIGLEPLHEVWRDEGRPVFRTLTHLMQEPAVPGVPMDDASVEINHDPPEQVLDSRIEGVQQGRQCGELDWIGILGAALLQQRTMDFQKLSQLSLLDGDLISQLRPHVEGIPCSVDTW